MNRIGKPQKSNKHKKLKPVATEYLELWQDKRQKNRHGPLALAQSKAAQQNINAKPTKPNQQEIPQKLKELIQSKNSAKERKKKRQKKKEKLADDFILREPNEKGMTRPVEQTPSFKQRAHENERAFFQRVNVECKNYIDKVKFEVANAVTKPGVEMSQMDDLSTGKKKSEIVQRKKNTAIDASPKVDKSVTKKRKLTEKKKATGFERFQDKVRFGEVAMAPPRLTAKPRGLKMIVDKPKKVPELLLTRKLTQTGHEDKVDLTGRRRDLPVATRRKLDTERERIVELYREIKARQLENR